MRRLGVISFIQSRAYCRESLTRTIKPGISTGADSVRFQAKAPPTWVQKLLLMAAGSVIAFQPTAALAKNNPFMQQSGQSTANPSQPQSVSPDSPDSKTRQSQTQDPTPSQAQRIENPPLTDLQATIEGQRFLEFMQKRPNLSPAMIQYFQENLAEVGQLLAALPNPHAMVKDLRFMIDPGHGGGDTGTCATDQAGVKQCEKDFTLSMSQMLYSIFEYKGFSNIQTTRAGDYDMPRPLRQSFVSHYKPHKLISIHVNSTPQAVTDAEGTHIYVHHNNRKSFALAVYTKQGIQSYFPDRTQKVAAIYSNDLYPINGKLLNHDKQDLLHNGDSILIETDFADNPPRLELLKQTVRQFRMMCGAYSGAINYSNALAEADNTEIKEMTSQEELKIVKEGRKKGRKKAHATKNSRPKQTTRRR